jgi:cytochrome c biogenesis protein ResB
MILYEGETDNRIMLSSEDVSFGKEPSGRIGIFEEGKEEPVMLDDADPRIGKLPFALRLKDFRIEYYDAPQVILQSDGQKDLTIPAEEGREQSLGDQGTVTVLKVFRNLKLGMENGQMVPYDQPGPDSNPAVQLVFRAPDGKEEKRFAFAAFPGHGRSGDRWSVQYSPPGMIKDYFSDLEVVENGQVVKRKTIEVNDPLYYGGYFFYQHSYDAAQERYTVLLVTSARGLVPVFLGFALVVVGSFWHFWIPRRRMP